MSTVAVILARGGSQGIPGKNLKDFCGKPLVAWTIEHARDAAHIDSVWVSSDDPEILSVGESYRRVRFNRTPGGYRRQRGLLGVRLAPCARCAWPKRALR